MKVLAVVHSLTGNTLYVVNRLIEKIKTGETQVEIEKLEPVGGENTREMNLNKIKLLRKFNPSDFDTLILACPVRGFSMSSVLKAYMAMSESFNGKKVVCLVTHYFPFAWMGGTRAIRQMVEEVQSLGGEVIGTGIISWKVGGRESKIEKVTNALSQKLVR